MSLASYTGCIKRVYRVINSIVVKSSLTFDLDAKSKKRFISCTNSHLYMFSNLARFVLHSVQ